MSAQRGRRAQPGKDPAHPAMAQHVEVADRIGAGDHAGDQGRNLECGVRARRSRNLHMLAGELVQAGLLGQSHHRRQPATRHQIRVIKHGLKAVADFHCECSL